MGVGVGQELQGEQTPKAVTIPVVTELAGGGGLGQHEPEGEIRRPRWRDRQGLDHQSLLGHHTMFRFYSKQDGKFLEKFKWKKYMISFLFLTNHELLYRTGWEGRTKAVGRKQAVVRDYCDLDRGEKVRDTCY